VSVFSLPRDLRRAGVLGINRRNADYLLRRNRREFFPRVDDKLRTKRACERIGLPVPALLAVARHPFELRELARALEPHASFVVKPGHGAQGGGILVIQGRDGDRLLRSGGRWMKTADLLYHAAGILSGLYALAGQPDQVLVEERLETHPVFADISFEGVPDVRVIVYRGVPVMAMIRLPTRRSGGRANLHQGAVGVGVDLRTGTTTHAAIRARPIDLHPDTGRPVTGRRIPDFDRVLEIAVHAAGETGLGYVGCDVVVDPKRGPVVLELNARPGLAIQIANRAGLLPRLQAVDELDRTPLPVEERLALGRRIAGECPA
jgi:alpha-L-glutamate ligase-like protein